MTELNRRGLVAGFLGAGAVAGLGLRPLRAAEPAGIALTGDIRHVHDPAVILAGDGAHLFSTSHVGNPDGLIHWRTSPDLKHWTLRGGVFSEMPGWTAGFNEESRGLWAPDIIETGGEYRLYYSVSSFGKNLSAIGLATATVLDPEDPGCFTDQGPVFTSDFTDDYNAIDPNILIDNDGRHWMSFGSFWTGIKIVELDPATGRPLDGADLHDIATRQDPPFAVEAPFIAERDGWYYLFVSFDFCCRGADSTYNTVVGRSRSPEGPYVDQRGWKMMRGYGMPVLHADLDETGRFAGPGHPAILRAGDNYLIFYHAYDTEAGGTPTLRLQRLAWTEQGWPVAM